MKNLKKLISLSLVMVCLIAFYPAMALAEDSSTAGVESSSSQPETSASTEEEDSSTEPPPSSSESEAEPFAPEVPSHSEEEPPPEPADPPSSETEEEEPDELEESTSDSVATASSEEEILESSNSSIVTIDGMRAYTSGFTKNIMAYPKTEYHQGKGKWYCEIRVNKIDSGSRFGVYVKTDRGTCRNSYTNMNSAWICDNSGSSEAYYGLDRLEKYYSGDVVGIAIDGINNAVTFYKNGKKQVRFPFSDRVVPGENSTYYPVAGLESFIGDFDYTFALRKVSLNLKNLRILQITPCKEIHR